MSESINYKLRDYKEVSHFKYWVIPLFAVFIGRIYLQATQWNEIDGKKQPKHYFIKRYYLTTKEK